MDPPTEIAYSRLGEIYFRANRIEDSKVWYDKAYAVLAKVAENAPDDPIALRNLALTANQLADTEWRLGQGARSRELHAFALDLRRKRLELVKKASKPTEMDLADAQMDIADALQLLAYDDLRMGDPVSAIANYTASDKAFAGLPPPLPNFLKVRRIRNEIKVRLADAHARLGKLDKSEQLFRAALVDREALLKAAPRPASVVALLKTDVGQSRMYLGDFLLMYRKDRAAAGVQFAACLESFAALLKEEPDHLDLRQRLAATHYRLGLTVTDPDKAKQAYDECLKIRQEMARIDPKDMQAGVEVAIALGRAGKLDEAEKVVASLLKQAGKDRQVLLQVACTLSILSGVTADKDTASRRRDQAFQVLRDLVKAGSTDSGGLKSDPDFDFIRDDPRFKQLLQALPNPTEVVPPR